MISIKSAILQGIVSFVPALCQGDPPPGEYAGASRDPTITVGLPVFNGAPFLRQAIDTLLAQTYRDFELIVSDNASTDDTVAIVEEYVARDSRVRLVRHPENIGAARNWNSLVPLARGRYFKWASCNDYVAPAALARYFAELESDESLILCAGRTILVSDDGTELGLYARDVDAMQVRASDRFRHIRRNIALNNLQSGLIRTELLRATSLERIYPGGDLVLVAELALYGRLKLLPEPLFYRRVGASSSTLSLSGHELQRFWSANATSRRLPLWRTHFDNMCAVLAAPIPLAEKARALLTVLRNMHWDRSRLWHDIVRSLRPGHSGT